MTWHGDIPLEENDDVVNVHAYAVPDPRGGFLVWDQHEAQIRHYAPHGRLLNHFGRKGEGPSEFQFPKGAMRRASGAILAFDAFFRAAEFNETGETLLRTFRTPVGPLQSTMLLDDSLVLLGGRLAEGAGDAKEARLHLWSIAESRVRRSFFAPALPSRAHVVAGNTAGFVSADRRGDTIAATFSLSDTVFFFDLRGNALGQVPIRSRFFRRLPADAPLPGANEGVVRAREWLGTFSLISSVYWMRDGTLLVQYQDRVGTEPRWRLLGLRRNGERIFEVYDSPYLVTVDAANDWLYFVKPGAAAPNVWSRARLRR